MGVHEDEKLKCGQLIRAPSTHQSLLARLIALCSPWPAIPSSPCSVAASQRGGVGAGCRVLGRIAERELIKHIAVGENLRVTSSYSVILKRHKFR